MDATPSTPILVPAPQSMPARASSFVDRLLSNMNDWHLPFGGLVFITGSFMQYFKHLDATFVTFSTSILTFVGTHAYIKGRNGNDDSA